MKKIKCINDEKFNYITLHKVYDVEKETRDFYFVVNDSGLRKRYGKSHFEEVNPKPKAEKKPPKRVERKEKKQQVAVCYFVKPGLTYKKQYPFTESKDSNKITITNDNGEKTSELRKRFAIEG